jgi:hypothetical protein
MGEVIRQCAADATNPEWADRVVAELTSVIRKEFATFADRLETAMRGAITRTPVPAERSATPTKVFVRFDSPEWRAWQKYRPLGLPDGSGSGWWFDTEWPPNHPMPESEERP